MSLQPPTASGAIAVQPTEIAVTDNGQTVYVLGMLAYKVGNGSSLAHLHVGGHACWEH